MSYVFWRFPSGFPRGLRIEDRERLFLSKLFWNLCGFELGWFIKDFQQERPEPAAFTDCHGNMSKTRSVEHFVANMELLGEARICWNLLECMGIVCCGIAWHFFVNFFFHAFINPLSINWLINELVNQFMNWSIHPSRRRRAGGGAECRRAAAVPQHILWK